MSLPMPPGTKKIAPAAPEKNLTIKELQAFMQKNGLSVYELADILGVTIQAINLWLAGKRDISVTTTRLIRLFIKYPTLLREFGSL